MKFFTIIFIVPALTLSAKPPDLPIEAPAKPLMEQVAILIRELAEKDGFSDEDATKVSVLFLEKMIGPKPKNDKLSILVLFSSPESVRIYVGYDSGIAGTGYNFEFKRGDPARGLRYANFYSLENVPGA